MADEPENMTLALLREIRGEIREGFEKAFGDLAELRDELRDMGEQTKFIPKLVNDVADLQHEVAAMRVDQSRTNELLEQVHEVQQNQGARLNVIEGRLALIEKHTGMVQA
jgi:NTP pyrophosphatase (non-canonical NTP hydrolase)